MRSSRSPVPRPWVAETASGSPSPSPWNSAARCVVAGPVDLVRRPAPGTSPRAQDLGQLGVARAQAGARVDDQQRPRRPRRSPTRAWRWTSRGQLGLVGEVDAAGVDQLEGDAVPLAGDALAVAGDPGSAWVTASRPPASRLTSVLLPTFGKPTTATVGCGSGRSRAIARHARPRSRARPTIRSDDLVQAGAPWCRSRPRRRRRAGRRARASGRARRARAAPPAPSPRSSPVWAARRRARSCVGRGEEDLQRRVGADDGADVAALGDEAAGGDQLRAGARPSPRAPAGGRRRGRRPRVTRGSRIAALTSRPSSSTRSPSRSIAIERDELAPSPPRRRDRPRARSPPAPRSGTSPRSRDR